MGDAFPDVLRIESVGLCNFKCMHCPTGVDPNNRAVLEPDRFEAILDQCRARGFVPRVVVLYHGGEPLMNRHLADYIRILKAMGVSKTVITTNASLLTAARAEDLLRAGLDEVKISFDGESPEENDLIRKNGRFHKNAANVRTFLDLRRSLQRPEVRVIVSNVRLCDRPTLLNLAASTGTNWLGFEAPPAYLSEYFQDYRHEMVFRSFPAMVWPGYGRQPGVEELVVPGEQPDYCDSLFETFSILTSGDVVLCCYDLPGEFVMGNVFTTSMFDIWASAEYATVRANFRKRVYGPLCQKCTYVSGRYLCRTHEDASPAADGRGGGR